MPNAGDIVQITFRSTCLGSRIMLTHYYRLNNSVSGSDKDFLTSLLNALDPDNPETPGEYYRNCLPSNTVMQEVRGQIIYPVRTAYHSFFFSLQGNWPAVATTTNTAAALTLKTNKAGRSQKATKHIGPLAPDAQTAASLSGTYSAAVGSLADSLGQSITLGGGAICTPIIYHKNADGPANKYDVVTGRYVNPYVRVMRRRTLGLGE